MVANLKKLTFQRKHKTRTDFNINRADYVLGSDRIVRFDKGWVRLD